MELNCWSVCTSCSGFGKVKQKNQKKVNAILASDSSRSEINSTNLKVCNKCNGKGIVSSEKFPTPNLEKFPNLAIIGLGISGITLAVACLHRGIPFTIFERDAHFDVRSQGYGLTLQQASKIVKALGIDHFNEGIVSTRHLVHTEKGEVVGMWGKRKWIGDDSNKEAKKSNIHIARQQLRLALLNQLPNQENVCWNHQLVAIDFDSENKNTLHFLVNGEKVAFKADLVVGADGIRSTVRNHLFKNETKPLNYLGCLVILGICSLDKLQDLHSDLLDGATVFQTANGVERIYVMPFSKTEVMWQLSFPMNEDEAINLSRAGADSLKSEAIKRTQWHSPVPEIVSNTSSNLITGYPVYDREILHSELSESNKNITLIGDAAHPMSPFKGQGANQAMLDGLSLARLIYKKYKNGTIATDSLRADVLEDFETEMLQRASVKVNDSAKAASFLHSENVLHKSDQPRR